jgi:adenosylhomocysteine nucleosidase
MKIIGIVAAMQEEFEEIEAKMKDVEVKRIKDLRFLIGKIGDYDCTLVKSGVGKVHAARTTQVMIDNFELESIINVGVAGSINNNLNIGDVVIGKHVVQHDFDITAFNHEKVYIPSVGVYIDTDTYLLTLADSVFKSLEDVSFKRGIIASGDIFCTELKMSQKINSKFNALCVEMEGASIAQVCYLSHVPFLIIRSISDVPNNNNVVTYEEFLSSSCKVVANAMSKVLEELGKE